MHSNITGKIYRSVYVFIIKNDSPVTEPTTVLQQHINTLSLCLINPVKVSQLLFSERYISEVTLDRCRR